jgi:P27 family predicted phage terminase small subunit
MTALRLLRPRPEKTTVANGPIPNPPEHLDPVAVAKWLELAPTLDMTRPGTADTLTLYVTAWTRWKAAEAKAAELGDVIKSPAGYPVQNPYLSIANKALDQLLKIGKRLGIAALTK